MTLNCFETWEGYIKTIHPVYQIIFIDDIDKDNLKLIDIYRSTNEEENSGKV